ncbi:uncharacterized protein LOC116426246 isoform X2 [Nomia melanderi]|uniref:uncharacterized protein LOC116426246 isoform X2 n=1 Tax=Nomia melanderi TaxID=2448451 RepID=UPI00130445DE|nr:uncharacterized protein LOC116426246 isoform X2 [Nomia melanderi]
MPFWNFIRDIFRGGNSEELKNKGFFDYRDNYDKDSFRNPIWQNDEDDDDDMDDFRHFRGGIHFRIVSDPLEITKYFESQMDNILKQFFFGFHNEEQNIFTNAVPFTSPQEENLRDQMLKPNTENFSQVEPKLDLDLDGKITPDNFSNVWDKYDPNKYKSEVMLPYQTIIGKSIRKELIHKPDGTIEKKEIIKDSEGNEETTISRQIADNLHTITIKKDKNGVETRTENVVTIDRNELKGNKWLLSNEGNDSTHNIRFTNFPWKQFFKLDPKL